MIPVRPLPLPAVVFLVNEWSDATRDAAGEQGAPYPPAADLTARAASVVVPPTITEADLIATANSLRAVFIGSASDRARTLEGLRGASGLVLGWRADDTMVMESWSAEPRSGVLAAGVLAIVEDLRRDPDVTRFDTCSGTDCADVFVDTSPAQRRRFCSVTCQNRARARAFRARRSAS